MSAHDIYALDFYIKLIENGCSNISYIKEPNYLKVEISPDAFLQFQYGKHIFFILLEVDLTHFSNLAKFQKYEKLFKSRELQKKCYGTFPIIIVMSINTIKYQSNNFDICYIDFELSDFRNKILGLEN